VGGVTITSPITGASNVSIDTTSANGGTNTPVNLDGPALAENTAGSIALGVHTLTLPTGWKFITGSSITIGKAGAGFSLASGSITPDLHSFSFEVTSVSTSVATVMFFDLRVVPESTVPSSGEITYSGTGMGGISGSWGTLTSVAGAPTQLKITDSATGGNVISAQQIISGQSITVYPIETDQFGNFVGNVAANWSLTNKNPETGGVTDGDLSGNGTSAVLTGNKVGAATIHAVVGAFSADSGILTVAPGPVSATNSTIGVGSDTAIVSNGTTPITVVVTAKDTAGNLISGKTAVISATGSDNPINPASAPTDANGVATFTISSIKAEQKIISATIEGNSVDALQNKTITFTHDVASKLSVMTQPSATAVAGIAFAQQPVINVLDQFGNLVANSAAVVTATKHADGDSDVLKGTLTATASGGIATFSGLNYEKATIISIDFSSGSLTPATSGNINISPADPAIIAFTTAPATVVSDTVDGILSTQPIVSVKDTFGNNILNGSVILSVGAGAGNLRTTLTQSISNGLATFTDIGYSKTDTFSITATAGTASATSDPVSPLLAGIINNFTLLAASPQTAGIPFSVSVSGAVDQFNNPANGTVTITGGSTAPNETDVPTYNPITVEANGEGAAQATLVNATPTTLTGTAGLITKNTALITVNPATASQIILTADPSTINASNDAAKAPISSTITGQLKDQYGNTSTTSGVSVMITTDKGAVTATTVTDANGQVNATLTSGGDITAGVAHISATTAKTVIPTTVTFNDVTAPDAPVITAPIEIIYVNANNYTITGTAEANSLVQIYNGTVVASQQLSGGATSFSISAPLAQNSVNNFTVTAKDAAGNENLLPTEVVAINEDSINPSVVSYTLDNAIISPNYSIGIQDLATFDVAFSEEVDAAIDIVNSSGAQVNNIYDSSAVTNPDAKIWNGKNTANAYVADGIYTIKIVITDKAGNSVTDTTKTVTVDNAAPTVALTYSADPAKAGAMTITTTYSEPIIGTPQITIDQQGNIDGTGAMSSSGDQKVWTYSYTVNTATGGTYIDGTATVSLSIVADVAGNAAGAPFSGDTFVIDTTPPTATITSPTADTVVKNTNGNVSLAFDSTGGSTCEYKVGNGSYAALTSCDSPKTVTLTDGRKSVVLKVTDTAGNFTESAATSFVIDTNSNLTVDDTPANNPDFATIQAAVNAATAGDTVSVATGTYAESVVIGTGLTLQGTAGAIIAPAAGPGIQINISPILHPVTVDSFTITPQGSTLDSAQGIVIGSVNNPVATHDITISNNAITTLGQNMGILVRGVGSNGPGYPNSSGLTVTGNTITLGGDSTAFYSSWVTPAHSNWSITHNTFNSPIGVNLQLHDVDGVTVDNNIFEQAGSGGSTSVFFVAELSNLTLPIVFSNNDVRGSGANLVSFRTNMNTAGPSTMDNVSVTGNTFNNWVVAADRQGLGIYPRVTSVIVQQNRFIFMGGGTGLRNTSDAQVDAAQNWWGTTVSADIVAKVAGSVDYRPWCTNAACSPIDPTMPTVTVSTLLTNDTTPTVTGTVNEISVVKINVNGVDYTASVIGTSWSADVLTHLWRELIALLQLPRT